MELAYVGAEAFQKLLATLGEFDLARTIVIDNCELRQINELKNSYDAAGSSVKHRVCQKGIHLSHLKMRELLFVV